MKNKVKFAAVGLAVGILFSACSKDDGIPEPPDTRETDLQGDSTENPNLLTGVYAGTSVVLDKGEDFRYSVMPYVDRDSGEITFVTSKTVETEEVDENGEIQYGYTSRYYTVRIDGDLNVLERKELDLGENVSAGVGIITKDYLVFEDTDTTIDPDTGEFSYTSYLHSLNLATGEHKVSEELGTLLATDATYIKGIVTDGDGNIYTAAEMEVIVFDSSFIRQYSVPANGYINSLAVSPDGRVFISNHAHGGSDVYEIDTKNHRFSEGPVYSWDSKIDAVLFGEGYDYYFANDSGIYGQSGEDEPELLMNYLSSDIDLLNFNTIAVIDRDTVLASDSGFSDTAAVLYRKIGDIDLTKIPVIEVAAVKEINNKIKSLIVDYNKEHRDVRINVTDYSQYSTKSDKTGGAARLGNDMASGLYRPDIVIADRDSGGAVIDYLVSSNLFADYNEILSDKPEVLDDMFGGIRRVLTTPDGRIWGVAQSFTVSSLLTVDPALMDKTSWTLDEMLDFNDSLPEGTVMLDGITRESFFAPKSSFYYESFVDMENYSCNFENETFYRLLDYIAGIPTEEEFQQAVNSGAYDYGDNYFIRYHEGKVALYPVIFRSEEGPMRNQIVFNTADYNAIGYPTDSDYGSIAEPEDTYIITTWCENPDAAWDFIDSLVRIHEGEKNTFSKFGYGIPTFRSVYDYQCDFTAEINHIYKLYYSGSSESISANITTIEKVRESMDEPGIVTTFDKAAAEEFAEFLDNSVGGEMTSSIPGEIMEIIGEEVSAYAAGVNTAENCASKIQSRVSIWLSEHE